MKYFQTLLVIVLFASFPVVFARSRINNLYELLCTVDKSYFYSRKKCNYRDECRREYLSQDVSDAIFVSDTIHILTGLGPDYIVGSYFESVRGDSVHYYITYGSVGDTITTNKLSVVDDLIIRGKYTIIPFRKFTRNEEPYWYTKVVRRDGIYVFEKSLFYLILIDNELLLVQNEITE